MNPRSRLRSARILVALAWLFGCSVLPPRPDPSRFYTLSPTVDVEAGSPREPQTVLYGLGPIDLAPYLDRDQVAVRLNSAELRYSQTDFWAEPLKTNVPRVLLQNLSTLLGADRIVLYPWPATVAVDYQVIVGILRFERTAAGGTELRARWTIRDPRSGEYLALQESNLARSVSSAETADAVDALSADLGDLSREIAAALRKLRPPRQPPSAKRRHEVEPPAAAPIA